MKISSNLINQRKADPGLSVSQLKEILAGCRQSLDATYGEVNYLEDKAILAPIRQIAGSHLGCIASIAYDVSQNTKNTQAELMQSLDKFKEALDVGGHFAYLVLLSGLESGFTGFLRIGGQVVEVVNLYRIQPARPDASHYDNDCMKIAYNLFDPASREIRGKNVRI